MDWDQVEYSLMSDLEQYLEKTLDEDAKQLLEQRRYNRKHHQSTYICEEIEADIIGDDNQLQVYSDELDFKITEETSRLWTKYKL